MNNLSQKIIKLLKKLPIDVGQAEKKHNSAGKLIACSFIKKVSKKKKLTALDVGCRDGYWSRWLKRKGYKVTSLDIEPHYKGAIKHDVMNGLPFKDKTFDLVFCTEVVEHLQKPKFFLKEVDRVLRKKGKSIFTTPNSNWFFYSLVKPFGWTPKRLQNSDHKQFFDETQIRKLFVGYRVYGFFPYAFFFLKIRYLIGLLSPTFVLVKKK